MEKLADLRRTAGFLTQESFAMELGVNRAVVAKWESGKNYPKTPLIPQIAQLLNTTEGKIIKAIDASKRIRT